MIILQKDAKEATSMSQCLIAGAAIAGLGYNAFQRHPVRNRPLIDLPVVAFLVSGGAGVGCPSFLF